MGPAIVTTLCDESGSGELVRDIEISDPSALRGGVLTEAERSGVLALHALPGEKDPNHERPG